MQVARVSPLSGKLNSLEVDCLPEQIEAWQKGRLIQNVLPQLSAAVREFLISGYTPAEQEILFATFPEE